jgi:hypothetical protein
MQFLGSSTKFRKATVSLIMSVSLSVCLSAQNNSYSTGRIFIQLDIRWIFENLFIIKPTRCTIFPNLLRHETLHVSGSYSAHHQEFIHCTLGTGICHRGLKTAFEQDQDGPARMLCSNLYMTWHIPVPSVQWINSRWWAEELPETCRVSCWSKFGKLVHLVGFII